VDLEKRKGLGNEERVFYGVGVGFDEECGRIGKRIKNPPTPPS